MSELKLTQAQHAAIQARGNVLVMAGAGTGKTRTLVERCLACLTTEKPRVSVDEILMVTFTEAAAAEMRQRIRQRLEEESQKGHDRAWWQEQLALFETAHIGTLHSFCLQLVRQHFYHLDLDPQLSVLDEDESRLLAEETLDKILKGHYAGGSSEAEAVQSLIQTHGRGWDKPIRELVFKLHTYAQSLPDPAGWSDQQLKQFAKPQPSLWRDWLSEALKQFSAQWLPVLEAHASGNWVAQRCAKTLQDLSSPSAADAVATAFRSIEQAKKQCPRGRGAAWLEPLKDFFADAEFLGSLLPDPGGVDPLVEDWGWVRQPIAALLSLAGEFSRGFAEAKRELGVLNFQDLEQYSLELLWDRANDQPRQTARQWQEKLRLIFVDEYQDINAAQDKIIQALARPHPDGNRFLVGDVKQSIYRFRLANPQIFQSYAEQWREETGKLVSLVDNFRSREALLQFVNSVFELLAGGPMGVPNYETEAALRFGAPEDRAMLGTVKNPEPAVELHLIAKSKTEAREDNEVKEGTIAEVIELAQAEQEAFLAAQRLTELRARAHPVWDLQAGGFRPVDWKDMAVLLRSPARKAERYARVFSRFNVPLQVARSGFYESIEISDLLHLLQLLDNPLQDLPALAVLHSPLVGLAANELAEIRLKERQGRFWAALLLWHQSGSGEPLTRRKVGFFLERFERWRRLAQRLTLSRCLETILAETNYPDWLLTQVNGSQRHANVQRLLSLAQDFDQFQRQGLFRFLRFVEAQKNVQAEPAIPPLATENAVRLMSIHQSKGLEFPVVVLADLGKPFNLIDLRGEMILDEQYGVCPQVKPPQTGQRYPSLAYWLARRRQLRELLGEESRLLYVAMTRARDVLILTGTAPEKKIATQWASKASFDASLLLAARSYIDWLGLWFSRHVKIETPNKEGETPLFRWFFYDPATIAARNAPVERNAESASATLVDLEAQQELVRRLSHQYQFGAATRQPAKTSVSALRRSWLTDFDGEDTAWLANRPQTTVPADLFRTHRLAGSENQLSASEIGTAHHEFLRWVALDRTETADSLRAEADRLLKETRLTAAQVKALHFDRLTFFWSSELGRRIRAEQCFVHRELAFTARFSPKELPAVSYESSLAEVEGEYIIVQGIADLVVLKPDDIWLLDFKTDQLNEEQITARLNTYQPQLQLYALALSRIYQRPVREAWLYWLELGCATAVGERPAVARSSATPAI